MADCNHADSDRLGACIVGVSGVSRGECGRDIGFCLHHCGHLFRLYVLPSPRRAFYLAGDSSFLRAGDLVCLALQYVEKPQPACRAGRFRGGSGRDYRACRGYRNDRRAACPDGKCAGGQRADGSRIAFRLY